MPVQLEFGDPERGDEVIIPVAPEALPEDDRGAYPEDACEADTWKRFDEYPQKMARATAHLDAIPSDWKPPVPLHDKVAAAKKKMGRARPQMVPEEEPDDEDFEVPLGDDGRPRGETACLEEADRLREEHHAILRLPEYYRKLGLDESVIDLDKIERAFVKAYKRLQKNPHNKPKHLLEMDYDDLTVAQVCVMEHAKHTWAARGLGKVTRAADFIGKQARVVRAFGGDRVRARERAAREKAEAPAKAEAAASKLLKRHWKAGDVGTTSAGFSEVKAPPPPQKFHPPEVEINRGIYGFDVPEPPPVSEAELAALLRGAELVSEAPKEAEPGAKKPFNPFLVSH